MAKFQRAIIPGVAVAVALATAGIGMGTAAPAAADTIAPGNGLGNPPNGTGFPGNGVGNPPNGTGFPGNGVGNLPNGSGFPSQVIQRIEQLIADISTGAPGRGDTGWGVDQPLVPGKNPGGHRRG